MPIDDDFLKNISKSPGVYLMQDKKGRVLYVGKAGNLRNRVKSYFVKGGDERPRIRFLLNKVDSVRTILTETEKEALILENNLIKEHRPKYNVDLRDDKSFFSLRLNVSHTFPRLTLIRTQKIQPDGERYFGPYSSARDARTTLKFIQKLFPLRQCSEGQFKTCTRPCLNCQMKRCLCPCAGKVDPDEYARMVEGVTLLLRGKSKDLIRNLEKEMKRSSEQMRFEEAARIRDRIAAIRRTLEIQNVSFFHLKDQDVVGLVSGEGDIYVVQILSFRRGKLLSEDSFRFRNKALDVSEIMSSAVKQYYSDGTFVPREILLSEEIDNIELIQIWLSELRGSKVVVKVPTRGQGTSLIALALKNAHNTLLREQRNDSIEKALIRIANKLGLSEPPELVEGYDISNVAGSDPVGVKIAFRDGTKDKSCYRTFKMKGFDNQDDPGMIYQTLVRRLSRAQEDPLPDLFLIDGGKSQLNAAVTALQENLGKSFPTIAAIAKGRNQGEQDRIYLPNRKNPLKFTQGDPALMMLMQVRDESHRFAHSFHTKSRKKAVIRSELDNVQGIGLKKREALLKTFGSVDRILAASDNEIMKINGIGQKDVDRIRKHFNKKAKSQEVKKPIGLST